MLLKVLFVLAAGLEFVFVPLFLKYSWPDKCWKSFGYKMVCSALFFADGLLAVAISKNDSPFAKMIILGLLFGWIGDLFLHLITDKFVYFAIGGLAFLIGHIFYIIGFQKAVNKTYPDAAALAWYEILAVVMIIGVVIAFVLIKKIKVDFKVIAAMVYGVVISTMLVKAFRFCIGELVYGMNEHIVPVFLTVALGALLFVLSDGSLGLLIFGGQGGNKHLKWFNIGTYFAAQILLASSIFLIAA